MGKVNQIENSKTSKQNRLWPDSSWLGRQYWYKKQQQPKYTLFARLTWTKLN